MIRQPDGNYRMDHAVARKQKEILKAFGLLESDVRESAIEINTELMMAQSI